MLEWDGGTNPLRTDLLKNPLHPKDGRVRVPEEPGIGAEIDLAVLEKYLTTSRSSAV
jgi:L-alanine-DL-glutamate epimerase-like enolase superfamily enzyme